MSNVYEVGDLLVTREWGDTQRLEICVYKARTGSLFSCMGTCSVHHAERFVKNTESLPYSTRVIRAINVPSFLEQL